MAFTAPLRALMLAGVASVILAGCGADSIGSPGEGTLVPTPTPTPPTPTPTPTGNVTPAAACPVIGGSAKLEDKGTVTDGKNTWRNCAFPQRFIETTTIPKVAGVLYSLQGRVDVGTDQTANSTGTIATLNIDPGVTIFGQTGISYLVVNRGNKINAVGTPTQPIVFTSLSNVLGTANDQTSQQWGGVVLLGRAPITDCLAPGATPGTASCERETEGTQNALYGGAQPADSSGVMSYVQIRYSGFILSADKELQGLTPSGTGSGTILNNIQIHNSSDDGIEVFGGRANMSNLVITGAEDDSLDTDVGYQGNIQFVLAIQREGGVIGDSMMEIDSNGNEDQLPRQQVNISNFTFVQRNKAAGNKAAIMIRGAADYNFSNGVLVSEGLACVTVNNAKTMAGADPSIQEKGPPVFNSVQMQCGSPATVGGTGVTAEQIAALFTNGTNNSTNFVPSLTSMVMNGVNFVNGPKETAIPAFDATTLSSFFKKTNYIGAVKDAADTWYQGWTCNSSTANFGTSSKLCTAIPV